MLGGLPWAAEAVQWLRPGGPAPVGGYSLEALEAVLPGWVAEVQRVRRSRAACAPRRLLVVGYLRWWLEYAVALGLLLAGEGHEVDLAVLPYRRWNLPAEPFDVRRQRVYLRHALRALEGLIRLRDLSLGQGRLSDSLSRDIDQLSLIDVQYTLGRETLDLRPGTAEHALFTLRRERNRAAALSLLGLLRRVHYDAVIIPNGSILEFGAVYRAARHLGVRAITYEFGEQRQRMWLAQDDEVMRLDTSALWQARRDWPLTESELAALRSLYEARRAGQVWQQFGRQWQAGESQGAQAARQALGLDPSRPVALLCTNVLGDSLALDRQVFSEGVADWLSRTVRFFADRPECQLVVRVHPGELRFAGEPSTEIVRTTLPEQPRHVVVVPPESRINTYDLVELAHVGLAYTTTVGMEMAMSGVPVVVVGRCHYRGKGFTYDPESWDEYWKTLQALLARPQGERLAAAQVDLALRYAYRFFFEYPFPFPWHLLQFWDDIAAWPLERMLAAEERAAYERTLRALAGEPVTWAREEPERLPA